MRGHTQQTDKQGRREIVTQFAQIALYKSSGKTIKPNRSQVVVVHCQCVGKTTPHPVFLPSLRNFHQGKRHQFCKKYPTRQRL